MESWLLSETECLSLRDGFPARDVMPAVVSSLQQNMHSILNLRKRAVTHNVRHRFLAHLPNFIVKMKLQPKLLKMMLKFSHDNREQVQDNLITSFLNISQICYKQIADKKKM